MLDSNINIKAGYSNMHFDEVTAMLTNAYWCKGIEINEVEQGAMNSALVIGAFTDAGEQIGYGRVISDKIRFAYIMEIWNKRPERCDE